MADNIKYVEVKEYDKYKSFVNSMFFIVGLCLLVVALETRAFDNRIMSEMQNFCEEMVNSTVLYCAKPYEGDAYIIYNSHDCEHIRIREGFIPLNAPLFVDVKVGDFYMNSPQRVVYLHPQKYFPNINATRVIHTSNAIRTYAEKNNKNCDANIYAITLDTCVLG